MQQADWTEDCRILDSVDSTNAEAARLVGAGRAVEWIMARRQSQGRGRRGRSWVSETGNLFATHTHQVFEAPVRSSLRSFVASLALRDCIVNLAGGGCDVALKWPNDVLVQGQKVAGILLENIAHRQCRFVLTGFGVNLVSAPELADRSLRRPQASSLLDLTACGPGPEAFLRQLATALRARNRQFSVEGFGGIRRDWLAHAYLLDKPVHIVQARACIEGVFRTINDSGQAVVMSAGGRHLVSAADLSLVDAS